MALDILLSCDEEIPCFENFLAKPKADKGVIVAVALANKGALAGYTTPITVSALRDGTIDGADVIDAVRSLQKAGKAVFYPKGTVRGTKPMPTEIVSDQLYGTETEASPTGDITVTASIAYKYFHSAQTVDFHNHLRRNLTRYDLVYWTDRTVTLVSENKVTFFNIGSNIPGDASQSISGGFDFRFESDGEPLPFYHNAPDALEDYTKFTIAPPVLSSNITADACSGSCKRYLGTYTSPATGASGTLTFDVTDSDASCVRWQLVKCGGGALPTGIAINETTGAVTLTAFSSPAPTKFTVVAYNETCLAGEFCFEVRTRVTP